MLRCSVKPYEGNREFVFISYSHKDSALVFPVIEKLSAEGFRVWYDEGIDPGSEWPETIAEHLSRADCVIAFISNNSRNSNECKREISYALRKKINFISVFLEPTELTPGMEMQLSAYQAIIKHAIPSEDEFYSKLIEAKVLAKCREERQPQSAFVEEAESKPEPKPENAPAAVPAPKNVPAPENVPEKPRKEKKKGFLIFIVIGALAVAAIVGVIAAVSGSKKPTGAPGDTQAGASAPGDTQAEDVNLSDSLSDFTFELNGTVYKIPFAFSKLADNGWTIAGGGYSSETSVPGLSSEYITMANDGKRITVALINMSGNAKKLGDCKVGGIECELREGVDFKIAKGVTCDTTAEKVREAFGTPSSTDSSDDHTIVKYAYGDNNYVRFYLYDEESEDRKYSTVELRNFVADESDNTQINEKMPEYLSAYAAPDALGEDIFSGNFSLDGKLYTLPAPVSVFLADGWTIASSPGSIVSGGSDYAEIEKSGVKISVKLHNYDDCQTIPENCAVISVGVDEYTDDALAFELPGGLKKGLSKADVEAALPESFDYYESTYSFSYTYSEYKDRDFSLRISIDKEAGVLTDISLNCDTWGY